MTKDEKIQELEAEVQALNDYILMKLGSKGVKDAKREYAIQRTNELLEIRDIAEFEEALYKEQNIRFKNEHGYSDNKK